MAALRVLPLLAIAGCAAAAAPPLASGPGATARPERGAENESAATVTAAAVRDLARAFFDDASAHRVAELGRRSLTHARLWERIGPLVDGTGGMHRTEIGRSVEGRPLYAVETGRGPVRVLLWSQMHGDEPTATLALADLIAYFAAAGDPVVRRIQERLTVVMIPMLNPDGAERGRRENATGIDLNRDARRQATPEARALAAVHARLSPQFGFNLHDQAARRSEEGWPVALSLLAPPHEPQRSDMPTRTRAKRLASIMRIAADSLVAGRVTRYDDTYNPQAFGDAMQSWGTSTVLLETGTWDGDPDKEHLRRVNFAVLLAALDAIATGTVDRAGLHEYETLPGNGGPQSRAGSRLH